MMMTKGYKVWKVLEYHTTDEEYANIYEMIMIGDYENEALKAVIVQHGFTEDEIADFAEREDE